MFVRTTNVTLITLEIFVIFLKRENELWNITVSIKWNDQRKNILVTNNTLSFNVLSISAQPLRQNNFLNKQKKLTFLSNS